MSRQWHPPTQQTRPADPQQWPGQSQQGQVPIQAILHEHQAPDAPPPYSRHVPITSAHSHPPAQQPDSTYLQEWQGYPQQNQAPPLYVSGLDGFLIVPTPSHHGSISSSYRPPPADISSPTYPLPLQQQPVLFAYPGPIYYMVQQPGTGQGHSQVQDASRPLRYRDTEADDGCNIYLLYEARTQGGHNPASGGQRWMIGWPIENAPGRDMWRLLCLNDSMTTAIAKTDVFPTHVDRGKRWAMKVLGRLTSDARVALECIALRTDPADVRRELRDGEWLSVQWVKKVLKTASVEGNV